MNISLLFFILSAVAADRVQIKDMQCFEEAESAKKIISQLQHQYQRTLEVYRRIPRRAMPDFEFEYVTDTQDKFGRRHCIISKNRPFSEYQLKPMALLQKEEDARKAKKEISGLKDPWGGKAIDLSGQPKIIRACKGEAQNLNCDDLIITALMGQDDVIEYRFWLGARSGDGMVVHKSANNALELSKVMSQLKKDKENLSYSFSPKDQSAFVKDAQIGGK